MKVGQMKRIGIMMLGSFFLLTTAVFAGDEIAALTNSMFKDLAVKNSRQVLLDELDIKMNKDRLADAQEEADKNDYSGGSPSDQLKRRIIVQVDPLIAQTQLEAASRKRTDNLNVLKNDTYKAGMKLLLLNKELEKETEKHKLLTEKTALEMAKYQNGTAIETAVQDLQIQTDNKQIDVETVKNKIASAEYELNRLLGRNISDKVIIQDELIPEMLPTIDIEEVVQNSLDVNTAVFEKARDLEAKTLKLSLTAEVYKEDEKEYMEAKFEVEKAEIDLNETRISLEVDLKNTYQDLQNRFDQYEMAAAFVQLSQKKLDIIELKYKAGLETKEVLLSQQENHLDAIYNRDKAIYDFNITLADLYLSANSRINP